MNKIKRMLIILLATICIIPNGAFAQIIQSDVEKQKNENLRLQSAVQKYISAVEDEDSNIIITFNESDAIKNGESPEVIKVGRIVVEISEAYAQRQIETYGLVLPIWGNYCGPGYGTKESTLPPTDILDEGCKAHDNCYKPGGGFRSNCECNQDLIDHIAANSHKMSGNMYWTAMAIVVYFSTINTGC